jgi:hypothetical protein
VERVDDARPAVEPGRSRVHGAVAGAGAAAGAGGAAAGAEQGGVERRGEGRAAPTPRAALPRKRGDWGYDGHAPAAGAVQFKSANRLTL